MKADLLIGLRRLRRRWFVRAVAVALGAAGVAVLLSLAAVVDATLVKEPFRGADRLVVLFSPRPPMAPRAWLTYPEILEASEISRLPVAAAGAARPLTEAPDAPLRTLVSTNFFSLVGARPRLGRLLTASDDGVLDNAVISEQFWRSLGADPDVVGRRIEVGGDTTLTVVGVAEGAFRFPTDTSVWTPLDPKSDPPLTYQPIARLPDAMTSAGLAAVMPGWRAESLREYLRPTDVSEAIVFLLVGAMLLLVVWMHLALLLAGDALARGPELRLRMALGARAAEVQLAVMVEAGATVGLAAAAGWILARPVLALVLTRLPASLVVGRSVAIDGRSVVAFAAILGLGLAVAAIATLPIVRRQLATRLADTGGSGSTLRAWIRPARWIMAVQFAAATPALYVLGLAVGSYAQLVRADLGYRPDGVMAVALPKPVSGTRPGAPGANEIALGWVAKLQEAMDAVAAVPGVASVATSLDRPGRNPGMSGSRVWLPASDSATAVRAELNIVSGSYFDTLGIPVRAGRVFDPGVSIVRPRRGWGTVVIDTTLAAALGRGDELIGGEIMIDGFPTRVIGIVGAIRPHRPDEMPSPRYYLEVSPARSVAPMLLVRFVDPGSAEAVPIRAVADVVRREYGSSSQPGTVLLSDELNGLRADYRGRYQLLSLTGWTAAALAAAGVFAVAGFVVARRRRELAVRMVLGATRPRILWVSLRETLLGGTAGVAIGLLIGVMIARKSTSMLYAVLPADPRIFVAVIALVAAVGLAGAAAPMARAWRLDLARELRRD